MDEKDKKILEVLEKNANFTTRQISKRTLIPINTVHKRIKKLKEKKIILNYTVNLDRKKLGLPVLAYVGVTVDYKAGDSGKTLEQIDVAKGIKKINGVKEVTIMTGGTDILVKVLASDIDDLNNIVTKKMRKVMGVDKTQTSIVLMEV